MIQGLKNPKNAAVLGYGAIFLSALFFGAMGLFTRMVQGAYPASLFNMVRGILGILVLLSLSRFHLFPLKGKHFKLLAARGIFGGFASVCLFKAIIGGAPLATSTALLYTFPIFGAIFSWILLKEKLNAGEIVAVFVAFVGVYTILDPRYQTLSLTLIFTLLAGFLHGIVIVIIRVLRMTEIFYAGLWGALFFNEMISWTLVLGGGIVLASGAYLTLSEYGRTKDPLQRGDFSTV